MTGTTKKTGTTTGKTTSPIVVIDGKEVQLCAICNKPTVGDVHPNAAVYHWDCIDASIPKLDLTKPRK